MDDRTIGWVAEGIANSGHVRVAPLADGEALTDLFGNEMAEDGKLAGEVVIDPNNLFFQVRGSVCGSEELIAARGCRENSGIEESGCVRVDHAGRNRIPRK